MSRIRHPSGLGVGLDPPSELASNMGYGRFDPLRHATRLALPEE